MTALTTELRSVSNTGPLIFLFQLNIVCCCAPLVLTTQTDLCSSRPRLPLKHWFVDCVGLALGSWLKVSKYSLDNLLLVLVVEMIAEQQKKKNCCSSLWQSQRGIETRCAEMSRDTVAAGCSVQEPFRLPLLCVVLAVSVGDSKDLLEIKLPSASFPFCARLSRGLTLRSVLPGLPGQSDGQAWVATAALPHLPFPSLVSSVALCFSLFLSPSHFSYTALCHDSLLLPLPWQPADCSHGPLSVCRQLPLFHSAYVCVCVCVCVWATWIWSQRARSCCHSFCSHPAVCQ